MISDKAFNNALDAWITKEPEEYYGNCEDEGHEICEECGYCHICDPEEGKECDKEYEYSQQPNVTRTLITGDDPDLESIELTDEELTKFSEQ